jgi:hypothetical protein
MSRAMSEQEARQSRPAGDEWRGRYDLADRDRGGVSPGLVLAGLAAVGLGALAWYYLGPDLVRYMKIRDM